MAITLISSPAAILEGNYPNVWTLTSDASTIVEMSATIAFVGLTNQPEIVQRPNPSTTGTFTFDISNLLQDMLGNDLQALGAIKDQSASNSTVYPAIIQFNELLLSSGQLVLGDDLTISPTQLAINAAWQPENTQGLPSRIMDTSVVGFEKFLTNSPITLKTRAGESYQLGVYSNSSSISNIRVNIYNSSGLLSTNLLAYSTSRTGRYDICCGYDNIVAAGLSLTDATYYTINLADGSSRQSEIIRFNIDDTCYLNPVRVVWLNRWGGYDAYTFEGEAINGQSTTSLSRERYRGQGATASSRGRGYTKRNTIKQIVASTGLLTKETREWLSELFGSPDIYIVQNNQYIPVQVQDGAYQWGSDSDSISINITYAYNVASQRQ